VLPPVDLAAQHGALQQDVFQAEAEAFLGDIRGYGKFQLRLFDPERPWSMPKKRVSFRSSSRIRPLKASQMPFCIGLPGAMSCHFTCRCCQTESNSSPQGQ